MRILIIDDHAILRMGLSSLINAKKDMEVVGGASDGMEGVEKYLAQKPDVVIMDLMMPGMDGVETTRRIIAEDPAAKILLLTTFDTSDGISRALDAGAMGAIMKNCEFSELVSALHSVMEGRRYVSEEIESILAADPPAPPLSPRQLEILGSIVRGLTDQDIAKQLALSLDTVKEYKRTMFQKIGAANRAEAAAIALRKQILKL